MEPVGEPITDEMGWRWRGNKPSVTTIIKHGIPNPGLEQWFINNTAKFIEKRREETSLFGTQCHAYFEAFLKGELSLSEVPETHKKHVAAFMEWVQKNDVKAIHLEHPLSSEIYGYSGQADFIGSIKGVLYLADWKVTSRYAITNGYQLAAYHQAAVEHSLIPRETKVMGVQIERDTAKVKTYEYAHVDFCFKTFLAALEVFKGLYFHKLHRLEWPWLLKPSLEVVR